MNNAKQLKRYIVETIRKEVRNQREEIIKEVKAELFDLLISPSNRNVPSNNNTVPEVTEPVTEDIDRASLRQLFEGKMQRLQEGDTIMATTADVGPNHRPAAPVNDRLPETFTGKDIEGNAASPDAIERTKRAINRDYSALMKAMEKK